MPPSPIIMPQPVEQPRRYPRIIFIGVLLIIVAAVGALGWYFWSVRNTERASAPIEFVGAATTTWYTLSGNTLTRVDAPEGVTETKLPASGRALGALPDGSMLALTPLGLSRVTANGTTFQIIGSGGDGSIAPIGAASDNLSLVAFENQTTHAVDVYHFNPKTLAVTLIVAVPSPHRATTTPNAPDGYGYISSADGTSVLVKLDARGDIPAALLPKDVTANERIVLSKKLVQQQALPPATAKPIGIGIASGRILIEWSPDSFYSYALGDDGLGAGESLSTIQVH